jgi:hypothetical protein
MSWPFSPEECPNCRYFEAFDPPDLDDFGYEVLGFCRNPRIAMELYRSRPPSVAGMEPCPCYAPRSPNASKGEPS